MPILHTVTFIWWISKYTSFEDLCRYSCHDGCYDASLALPGQKHNLPVPTCSNHKSRIFSMSSEFFILYSASGSILIDRWSQVTPKKTPQPPFELIQLQGQWCQHDRELRGGVFAKVKGWQALPVLIDWMVFFLSRMIWWPPQMLMLGALPVAPHRSLLWCHHGPWQQRLPTCSRGPRCGWLMLVGCGAWAKWWGVGENLDKVNSSVMQIIH